MCGFAIGGMQTVMVDSVEEGQVNSCAVLLAPILQSIEMTLTGEVVDAECRGNSLFPLMHHTGFVTSSFATCGIPMAMVVSVEVGWEGNSVLVPTTGRPTTEMTRTVEEVAVGWLGNCVFRYDHASQTIKYGTLYMHDLLL
jgi:hypothetical protein